MINDPERLSMLLVTGPMVAVPVLAGAWLLLRPVHRTIDPDAGESMADGTGPTAIDGPATVRSRPEAPLRGR